MSFCSLMRGENLFCAQTPEGTFSGRKWHFYWRACVKSGTNAFISISGFQGEHLAPACWSFTFAFLLTFIYNHISKSVTLWEQCRKDCRAQLTFHFTCSAEKLLAVWMWQICFYTGDLQPSGSLLQKKGTKMHTKNNRLSFYFSKYCLKTHT